MNPIQIPAGYRQNSQGHLIPESQIKPIDLCRDELVQKLVEQARVTAHQLVAFKSSAFADIAAFVELSAEQYGARVGGTKGNVTLFSLDGRYKVQRAISEKIQFDERLQAAKALIDDCLRTWTENARPELSTLINDAFRVDQEGSINTGRVLGLRRLDIQDPKWLAAMRAIGDAVQVIGSKAYIRLYERVGDTDEFMPIALDVAGV